MKQTDQARVLVVEDLMLIALDIVEHLEEWGCTVAGPFPSVAKALPCAAGESLDCALLDVNLGNHHCFPLAAVLRGRGIPFVFLTGHDATFMPEEFRDVKRLSKPLSYAELRSTVADLCNCANAPDATPADL